MQKNANMDLMRSVAVFLVMLSHLLVYTHSYRHAGRALWFVGILGVSMFFVHTTLVLMWSLERDPHTIRFYVRRAFRIYPLWLVVLGLTVLLRYPASPAFAPAFAFYRPSVSEFVT